jgi:hypothetical protein
MSFSVMIEMAKKTLENAEVISDTRVRIPLSHNAIPFMSIGLFQNKVYRILLKFEMLPVKLILTIQMKFSQIICLIN